MGNKRAYLLKDPRCLLMDSRHLLIDLRHLLIDQGIY